MSPRVRLGLWLVVALALVVLIWLSRRGARNAPMARAPAPLPTGSRPAPEADEARRPARGGPPAPRVAQGVHPEPPGADELMPRPEAIPPKDPDGPVRDWRDFTPEEKAAQSSWEFDFADIQDVIERLEGGEEVARLRGAPVTPEEQQALREEIAAFAAAYEQARDRWYGNETTVIELADVVRTARARFDRRIREIYGLSEAQFYEMFPYRRELRPPQ